MDSNDWRRIRFSPADEGGGSGGDGGGDGGGNGGGNGGAAGDAGDSGGGDGGGGGAGATWIDGLPDELRQAVASKGYQTPSELARAYFELEPKIGAKGVIVPKPEAPKEAWAAFNKAVGVPEAPSQYEIAVPEGEQVTEELKAFHSEVRGWFHEAGLRPDQAALINKRWNEHVGKATEANKAAETKAGDEALSALRQEWGGSYDAKVAAGKQAARQFGTPEVLDKLEGIIGTAPLIKMFAAIGEALGDDSAQPTGEGGQLINTPADAKAEIKRLKADEDFRKAFSNPKHPEYAEAVARMQRLNAVAQGA